MVICFMFNFFDRDSQFRTFTAAFETETRYHGLIY